MDNLSQDLNNQQNLIKKKFSENKQYEYNNSEKDDQDEEELSQNKDQEESSYLDQKQINLRNLQQFMNEREVYKLINKFSEQKFSVSYILKQKRRDAFIQFESVEEKNRFVTCFNSQENKDKQKKLKLREKDIDFKRLKSQGKPLSVILKDIEKFQVKYTPSQKEIDDEINITLKERMFPLLGMNYEDQIKEKETLFYGMLKAWKNSAKDSIKNLNQFQQPDWIKKDFPCTLKQFLECDEQYRLHYRNKAEFSIGLDHEGVIRVGFNRGNQKKQIHLIEKARSCELVSNESIKVAELLENLIKTNVEQFPAYDKMEWKGFWRYLVVRQSWVTKQLLINIVISDSFFEELDQDKKNEKMQEGISLIKEMLINQCQLKIDEFDIVSLAVQTYNDHNDSIPTDGKQELLYGKDTFEEKILDKKFIVSANSFMQVNTPQCEKLYSLIGQIIKQSGQELDENTIFLDICSGIGTIGMCLADKCKEVIGIEMVQSSCTNAENNAVLNNITNYKVVCSKVEDAINELVQPYYNSNFKIVGVVDPPRAGLHQSVVKALRKCNGLKHLVYVACSPPSVIDNLNYLCLPKSKSRVGEAFEPQDCYGVDLFPQTKHFEGIFYLNRP